MNKKLLKLFGSIAIVITLIIVASSTFASSTRRLNTDSGLEKLALSSLDLPEGATEQKAGIITTQDISQPLNQLNESLPTAENNILNYHAAYQVTTMLSNASYDAYIGNYLYRYQDAIQAQSVATHITTAILADSSTQIDTLQGNNNNGLQGNVIMLTSDTPDQTFWFIGVKDDVVILLIANGLPKPDTPNALQNTFQDLITTLSQK